MPALLSRVEGALPSVREARRACVEDGLSMSFGQLLIRAREAGLRVQGGSREQIIERLIAWAQDQLSQGRVAA